MEVNGKRKEREQVAPVQQNSTPSRSRFLTVAGNNIVPELLGPFFVEASHRDGST